WGREGQRTGGASPTTEPELPVPAARIAALGGIAAGVAVADPRGTLRVRLAADLARGGDGLDDGAEFGNEIADGPGHGAHGGLPEGQLNWCGSRLKHQDDQGMCRRSPSRRHNGPMPMTRPPRLFR